MAITKTGIQLDTTSSFTNPIEIEVVGEARSVIAINLSANTRYYSRSYVEDGNGRHYSSNIAVFKTRTATP